MLSNNEYQVLVEQAPILIWRARPDTLCDYFNERWLTFRGRSMEEEFGNGWAEGVHAEDFERCLQIYLENFHARKVFEMEYRLMRHDGQYRWILDRGVPFYDEEGVFAGYIGSCIDVTDRVEAEERLNRAQQTEINQLRALLPICMYCKKIKDDDGYWNHLESYIRDRFPADFSHGLCPTCADKVFEEFKNR